ncbi:MAG: uridine monophosphate kinase [Erysipelotrichaceae bacterium]|nr:uridine monophosphate kinase [Erysipelotrichaceae bacterium]
MYKNILLKLSGESLMSDSENINKEKTKEIAKLIKRVHDMGINIGIVVGGGNFFRGRSHQDMEAINADSMGMLGTTMNALALRDAFTKENIPNLVFSPFDFHELIEYHSEDELKKLYKKGTVIVFSGGTGHIGCSTDTAASMKAIMIGADVIIKLTNVDGVYNKDPNKYSDASMYKKLTHQEVLDNPEIKVMDLKCIKDCMEENKDILVINFNDKENLIKVLNGENIGTVISCE